MADSFVPLAPKSALKNPSPGFRLKIRPQSEATASLARLHPCAPSRKSSPPGDAPEPGITLQRDGSRVTGIRIQCTCGQVIELACEY